MPNHKLVVNTILASENFTAPAVSAAFLKDSAIMEKEACKLAPITHLDQVRGPGDLDFLLLNAMVLFIAIVATLFLHPGYHLHFLMKQKDWVKLKSGLQRNLDIMIHSTISVRPGSCPAAITKYFNDEGRPWNTLTGSYLNL